MGQLFDELKRRNVIRVAIAYAVAAWALLQIADLVLDNIGAPDWVMKAFMLALALGFPLVLIFSWAFEMTPDGLKREKDADRAASVSHVTARKLDRVTIALLLVVLVIFAGERLLTGDETLSKVAEADATDKSIAVLAFEDLSPAGDQAYFAEGVSEELLNVLAQIPDLKVAGRTSSFAFKDQNRDLREIGEILEVAHILEGSVRTSGNRVRVTAQLVKADDGFHLFSRNYDRELTDIFAVQDDIAREISAALRSAILGDAAIEKARPTQVAGYEKYLRARQWIHSRDRSLMEQAMVLLDEALAMDPDYAPALAQKALVTLLLSNAGGSYGDIPQELALEMSRPLLDRALELDPDSAEAHAVMGLWHSNSAAHSSPEAIASLRRALEINPNMANANNWLASELASADSYGESLRLYEFVVEHDPLYRPAFNNLTFSYIQTRSLDKADALIRRVERIDGGSPNVLFARGALEMSNGNLAGAIEHLARAYEYNESASVVQLWYGTAAAFIGDLDRAIEVSYQTEKLVSLELAGRSGEADALYADLNLSVYSDGFLRSVGDWMLLRQQPGNLIALLEEIAGPGSDWLTSQPVPENLWGAAHWTNTAFALQKTGRDEDAGRMPVEVRQQLDAQARNGANNLFYWYNEAEYAALTGNRDAMLQHLQTAMDAGYVCVFGFQSATFERWRGDAGFTALENESIRRANAARRQLGLLAI
ncbi:MAG: hypothetical protein U5K76_15355 [Woeseiaceae bacterium]|nr:hypothetical protein [Woeseiaceae bacterium]